MTVGFDRANAMLMIIDEAGVNAAEMPQATRELMEDLVSLLECLTDAFTGKDALGRGETVYRGQIRAAHRSAEIALTLHSADMARRGLM